MKTLKTLLILTALLTLTACSGVQVPSNAQLLFYGPGQDFSAQRPKGEGYVYVTDYWGKVLAAMRVAEGGTFRVNSLKRDKTYKVYFAPSKPTSSSVFPAEK